MGKLAAVTCETAKPDPKRDRLLGDGDGLFLRIRPHGAKTWVVEYEFQGNRTKYTIGTYSRDGGPHKDIEHILKHGQLSLTQARFVAGSWKGMRRGGHDPVAEWKAQLAQEQALEEAQKAEEEAEAKAPTVNEAIESFMGIIMRGKKSASASRYRLDRLAAYLGDKKIRDVSKQDVFEALDAIATGQRGHAAKLMAGEVLTQSKRVWRFAEERGWVEVSCIEKVTRRNIGATPRPREVALRLDELAVIWRVLNSPRQCRADPVTIAAMKLLILTGQRESEVCGATWGEFDLDAGLWKIPADHTKKDRAHLVHLAPQSVEILEGLKKLTGDEDFVFASPLREKQPIYGRAVNNALATLFKNDHLPNVTRCTVHDFRRTLITRLPDLGFEPFLGHKIANHKLTGVFAHYNHNSYEEKRREALLAWAARVEALANESNVKQLHRAA